jgi:hypothetical protein
MFQEKLEIKNTNPNIIFMRKFLISLVSFLIFQSVFAQDISVRVRQVSFSSVDPDNGGPATGSVSFVFELKSSTADVLADGMGLSVVYQSSMLMATPTNTTMKLGPINTALWSQQVDNRIGLTIAPVTYGGISFDRRMIITFNQNAGVPDAVISGTTWTPVAQLTYYTLGNTLPQGGYIVPEPGTIVAQNELSSDGGLTTYPYLSPGLSTPVPLGFGILPVLFTRFEAQCLPNKTTSITWITSSESNNNYFEVERSLNGTDWKAAGKITAAGNSVTAKSYQLTDPQGGVAQYRIKQVDKDGKVTYSGIVRSTCDSRNVFVSLYPVPARDLLTLVVGSEKTIKTNLQIFDSKGRMVKSMPVSINKGQNSIQLRVESLAAGEYILKGTSLELEISQRFTILR